MMMAAFNRRIKEKITVLLFLAASTLWATLPAANGTENGNGNPNNLHVKKGDFLKTVILTGSLQAQKAEEFVVPYSSTWELQIKWMVKEGDYVKPGDPVVRFDTSNLVSEIENMEMSLEVKEEEKAQRSADYHHQEFELAVKLKQAQIDYKKKEIDASIPRGITTNYEYDRSQLELKKSGYALENARMEKQVKLADIKSQIKKMDIEIEEIRTNLENNRNTLKILTLYAQTAGSVIYGKHNWQGRKIQIGDSVYPTWKVAAIPDKTSLQVEAWVNETDIHRIKPGQKTELYLDAYPDKHFTGTIKDVLNSAEEKKQWGNAHYFRVDIEMNARDLTIMKPGMSVKCIVHLARYQGVLLVPLEMTCFDDRFFWVKPRGKPPLKITPLDFNEFYVALALNEQHREITQETLLEPVDPAEIKHKYKRKPGINSTENEKQKEKDQ